MDNNDSPQPQMGEAVAPTTSRRAFVKSGATLTGGLLLSGVYAKPRIQSIDLAVLPNPSGDPGSSDDDPKKPKKPKKLKKAR